MAGVYFSPPKLSEKWLEVCLVMVKCHLDVGIFSYPQTSAKCKLLDGRTREHFSIEVGSVLQLPRRSN